MTTVWEKMTLLTLVIGLAAVFIFILAWPVALPFLGVIWVVCFLLAALFAKIDEWRRYRGWRPRDDRRFDDD